MTSRVSIFVRKASGPRWLNCSVAQDSTRLDYVVRDDAESYPSPHALHAGIEATAQPVSSFEHADSTLRARPPLLPSTKPTLMLQTFPFATGGFLIGHRHPLHT